MHAFPIRLPHLRILILALALGSLLSQCKNNHDDTFQVLIDPTDSAYALHHHSTSFYEGGPDHVQSWVYYMRTDGYPAAAEYAFNHDQFTRSSETEFTSDKITVIGDDYSFNSDTVLTSHHSLMKGISENYSYDQQMRLEKVDGISTEYYDLYWRTYSYDQDGNVNEMRYYAEAADIGPPAYTDAVVIPSNTPTSAIPNNYVPDRAVKSPMLPGRMLMHIYSYYEDSTLAFERNEVRKMEYEQQGDTLVKTSYRWDLDSPEDSTFVRQTDKYWREELEPRRMIIWPE